MHIGSGERADGLAALQREEDTFLQPINPTNQQVRQVEDDNDQMKYGDELSMAKDTASLLCICANINGLNHKPQQPKENENCYKCAETHF